MNHIIRNRKSFLAGAFLFCCLPGPAQIYYFDNYSVGEGLAQSKVFSVIQDQRDCIWLGTEGGASRFDGLRFENFSSENGMAINGVRTLFQDSEGTIWMGHTGGGITLYRGKVFSVLPLADSLIDSDITAIAEDPSGGIWITTSGDGAFHLLGSPATDSMPVYEHYQGSRLSDRVFGLFIGRDETLYFITDVGVQRRKKGERSFVKYFIEGMGYFQITSVLEDRNGGFWFGTFNDGVYHYHAARDTLLFYNTNNGLGHNFVSCLYEDRRGTIWTGTWGGGITRIDQGRLKTFSSENGLPDQKIWCIMEDLEGNLLIGTNENGLSIFKGERFVLLDERAGLINNQVWAVLQDKQERYWFGTNGGISIWDPAEPEGVQFRHMTSQYYTIGNQVRYLREDHGGHIWIGTYENGTFEYDPAKNQFSYSFQINSYNQQLIVTAMEIDRENVLWVGTTGGLIRYDIDHRQVAFLTQLHGLAGNDISALFSDSEGMLWVGSRGKGITTIDGDLSSQLTLETAFTPTCIAESPDGLIWIGTEGQGIYAVKDRQVVNHLSRESGLLANLITLVNVDEKGDVLIGTNQGLNRYVSREDRIYTYTEKTGFTGIETKPNASYRDREGKLWFGTVAGVIRYDPEAAQPPSIQPLTHITRMRVNLEEVEMSEGLRLGYQENSIIFDFTSICLSNPDIVAYQYKLEGADPDWLPVTQQTTATYPSLRPGRYTFLVRARNHMGIWNETPVRYAFQIRPPFYATWWFILSCVILGTLGILAYITMRTRKLRRENLILEEKVRERTATVVAQKEELAQKNKDITDSIQYARRIQVAILPPDVPYPDTFILFKPKDIVSGDFYWLTEKDGKEFIAAVDCTGHGVPGAFMSIIGHTMLNKIVREKGITRPAEILKHLDEEVTKTLHQTEEFLTVRDGMDMTLIAFNPSRRLIEFSGAVNPVYLVRRGDLIETKGDRFAIGRTEVKVEKHFSNHEIKVEKGDTIYMFSDGYADQFGGEKGKKFKIAPMKELILNIQEQPMTRQREILDQTIEAWRGDYAQIDDILIIGRRF